jgi:hypothetical protein
MCLQAVSTAASIMALPATCSARADNLTGKTSVADPGCLSWIRSCPFFGIPDPDPSVFYPGSRIRILQIREGKN